MRSQQKNSESPDENEDIFKKNMLDRYMVRPDEKFQNRKFASVNFLCYAVFLNTTLFLLYTMKITGSLWNLLMTSYTEVSQ